MIPCRYAILRFLPYVETGEFANVGVVLMSTAGRYFGFRLLGRRVARVTHFFDLHDQVQPNALSISLGLGHLWRLAIDHPESKVRPCVHRAPKEKTSRLLLIC